MIRLIATDLDGTLLQNGAQSLAPEAISKIECLITEHDILFVAASGRQYPNLCRLFGSAAKHILRGLRKILPFYAQVPS